MNEQNKFANINKMSSKHSGRTSRMTATTMTTTTTSSGHRKHRSRSTSRFADLDKPKKKKHLSSASQSLVSIPNAIRLSMLNSGLMSFGKSSHLTRLHIHIYPHPHAHLFNLFYIYTLRKLEKYQMVYV